MLLQMLGSPESSNTAKSFAERLSSYEPGGGVDLMLRNIIIPFSDSIIPKVLIHFEVSPRRPYFVLGNT